MALVKVHTVLVRLPGILTGALWTAAMMLAP
jgi:hypothetical protein